MSRCDCKTASCVIGDFWTCKTAGCKNGPPKPGRVPNQETIDWLWQTAYPEFSEAAKRVIRDQVIFGGPLVTWLPLAMDDDDDEPTRPGH